MSIYWIIIPCITTLIGIILMATYPESEPWTGGFPDMVTPIIRLFWIVPIMLVWIVYLLACLYF